MQESNPYEPPSSPDSPGAANHIIAAAMIAPIAFALGMLLTPADPISMIIATVPIFVAMFGAYLFGFRTGKKR